MIWLLYMAAVLLISSMVGLHLGRFRAAYTEMTGMMAGMTMGMLNGFLLGFGAAAVAVAFVIGPAMFWGNVIGIVFGLALGAYFGRAGGLMGIMDGAMGGLMGGSMGAMLAVMVSVPDWALVATGALLGVVYLAGMFGLVLLIERSAPEHAALHRLAPWFTRAVAAEVAEVTAAAAAVPTVSAAPSGARRVVRPPAPAQAPPAARHVSVPPPSEQPVIWGGIMLVILVVLGALVLLTNPKAGALAGPAGGTTATLQGRTDTGAPLQPAFIQQLQAKAVPVPLKDGRQTLDLLVNGTTMSYSPGVIQVKRGMPVRLNLQITGADPGCGRVVSLQLLGAQATAAPGEVVPLDFTPNEAGVFQINCNMHMMEPGYLIVTD